MGGWSGVGRCRDGAHVCPSEALHVARFGVRGSGGRGLPMFHCHEHAAVAAVGCGMHGDSMASELAR